MVPIFCIGVSMKNKFGPGLWQITSKEMCPELQLVESEKKNINEY